jgi:gamma-glutamyltranspeptidase / glutathione hydrolase
VAARRFRYPQAAVASPHYVASATGLATLARGGNAVDAAVAANLTLGVVAPYLCGYGGDLFAIVWDGSLHGYLGSGRSPGAHTIDGVRERGAAEHMPIFGPDAVTVPGGVAGWFDLLARFGTRDFGELAQDAIRLARGGFQVTPAGAVPFAQARRMYRGYDAWEAVYGDVDAGSYLRQPALARLIELLAVEGPHPYYRGAVAGAIASTTQAAGGVLTTDDLASHVGEWAAPIVARYRDREIAELPPPTQGVTALEALRIADGLTLPLEIDARQHILIEATKQALADRDRWVADPSAMGEPAETLLADAWVADRRRAIDPERAGNPDPAVPQPGGTAYLCAADGDGLLVSLIQSNFVHFGSGVHVADWGINLNNRGFSFSLDPARPNVLAPGKRPMHTLIPAMALRDAEPWLVFGTMGGDAQPGVHLQLLSRLLDESADIADAVAAPRWRVDSGSWEVRLEARADGALFDGLRARGHVVHEAPSFDAQMGHAHAIVRMPSGYAATADPRSEGLALGR